MKYKFLSAVGLAVMLTGSIDANAMDVTENDGVGRVSPRSLKDDPRFIPPVISLGQYVNGLEKGSIFEGWEVNSLTADKQPISYAAKLLYSDRPLFLKTLHPVVDGDSLFLNYSFVVVFADTSRESTLLSLSRKATSDELSYFNSLPVEDKTQRYLRFHKWIEKFEGQKTPNDFCSLLYVGVRLAPHCGEIESSCDQIQVKARSEFRSSKSHVCNLSINGKDRKMMYSSRIPFYYNEIKMSSGGVIAPITEFYSTKAGVFIGEDSHTISKKVCGLYTIIFNINGELTFSSQLISLIDASFFCAGNVIFRSSNEKCWIKKVTVRAADSKEPIVISGILNLTEENPNLDIECQNANLIRVKLRKKGEPQ